MVNLSDAGTGKTRAHLEAWRQLKEQFDDLGPLLVLAPLSILEPAWANDCRYWTPGLTTALAYNHCREQAFESGADLVVMNHDGVNWLKDNQHLLEQFSGICIDEFTAFKNPNSDRSRALREIRHHFTVRWIMSATPTPNSVTDIWFPVYVCDGGLRLGKTFSLFRQQVCDPIPIPGVAFGKNWVDKPEAEDMMGERIRDICLRYKREECSDIPDNHTYHRYVELGDKARDYYEQMVRESVLELDDAEIEAVHAGARVQKLLQICSGAIYDEEKLVHVLDEARYRLIADLIEERDHTVTAFLWQHQRDAIAKELRKRQLSYAIIDGDTDSEERNRVVEDFQAGKLRTILAHPQSAGHGLTLTRGKATIWASPTYNAEHFLQFNARIDRTGQTRETETILVTARDTLEEQVYEKTDQKLVKMSDLLHLLKSLYELRNQP